MDISVFTNKMSLPDDTALQEAIIDTYPVWALLSSFVYEKYPQAVAEWNFPGAKYGWSFRIKDKKRAIIYLLPRDGYFMAAFVYGEKAVNEALESDIPTEIKTIIQSARVYAEGRGFRITINDGQHTETLKKLVEIKLRH